MAGVKEHDEFLTVAEIAEWLKVNQQTVRNWIDRGELVGIRLGARRVRVRASELDRFIADSSSAVLPAEAETRDVLADAYTEFGFADSPTTEAAALRRVARAATSLARILSS